MKKFAKITAVVLVAVMVLALLAACGYPSDPEDAKVKLEKQGYKVLYVPGAGVNTYATLTATKKDDNGKRTTIVLTYYTTVDRAKEAYTKEKEDLEKIKETNEKNGIKTTVTRYGDKVEVKTITNVD